ncbi:hypothetical protein ABDK00_018190 [Niabella insulamsoli]|uniref:hypothetical protein n=1 Tax=Niabella insulamsoli TaxID=3144874 RepID=UPI0031FBDC3D
MKEPPFNFKKIRADISLHYGIDLDETSLTILVILHQEIKRQFVKITTSQDEMAAQIQQSKKSLQVDYNHPRWQAFWHGMGQWGLGLCVTVLFAAVVFFIDVKKTREQKELLQLERNWYKAQYDSVQALDKKGQEQRNSKKASSKRK